jgi:hemerythrin-like domain-containing protein
MTSNADVRRDLFPTIRSALLAHDRGEMRVVYPAFRAHPDLEGMARDHELEADQLERLLDELNATECTDARWPARFADLVHLVDHHIRKEETDFFPAANRILGKEEAERLKGPYLAAKAEANNQATS